MHRCIRCSKEHRTRLEARVCCKDEQKWRLWIPVSPSLNRELAREDVLAKREQIQYEE